jgi:hypothetical protein
MNNPWIWRFAIILFAIVLVPTVIVPATASLIVQGINSAGATINDMLRPLSQSGDARLEGLIKLCLNLIFIAILVRFFVTRR